METLVLLLCLNSMSSCDEMNARAVWRADMTTLTCEEKLPSLVDYIKTNKLNPKNGYYVLTCRPLEPSA